MSGPAVEDRVRAPVELAQRAARQLAVARDVRRLPVRAGEGDLDPPLVGQGGEELLQRLEVALLRTGVLDVLDDVADGRRPLPAGQRHDAHDEQRRRPPAPVLLRGAQQERPREQRAEAARVAAHRVLDQQGQRGAGRVERPRPSPASARGSRAGRPPARRPPGWARRPTAGRVRSRPRGRRRSGTARGPAP